MAIILCCWGSIMENGIKNGFTELGEPVSCFNREIDNYDTDTGYLHALSDYLRSRSDASAVVSVNFIPIIAMACKAHKIMYISWTVDCPCLTLYSNTLAYPTNLVFLFDRAQYSRFADVNPGHIFHLPLGFDPTVAKQMRPTFAERKKYDCDVSFVGSLYTKGNQYDEVADKLSGYMRGYAEGLIAAQANVYGYNLIADSITDKWADNFMAGAHFQVLDNYSKDYKNFIADYYIGYKCTQLERIKIMRALSNPIDGVKLNTHLYTTSDTKKYPEINNRGIADSNKVMPKVFASSRINLNILLKSITSGIPLRCFDIMGMGGFLLSNYQPELAELFTNGEEVVMYESIHDLIDKVRYYLAHEDERRAIAAAGQKKVLEEYSFKKQIERMLGMIG